MKSLIFILFPVFLLAQEFMIQPNGSEPVVDPFTGDIYCRVFGEGIVKIRADGSGKVVNPFPHIALPVFAHKTHRAFYVVETDNRDSTEIYLVDFENDTIYLFLKISFGGIGGISPNDKYMYLGGKTERYYSFEKDTIFDTGILLNIQSKIDWINDSTIVYVYDENKIIRFCFTKGILDTLIFGKYITGLAVNQKYQIVAFSEINDNPTIKFFFLKNRTDSTVFDFGWLSDAGPLQFVNLKWDTSLTRLAFIGDYGWLVTASDIFVFDYLERKTFLYSEVHYGYKYFLNWLNKDTLIYENADKIGVFGFTLQNSLYDIPVSIDNDIHQRTIPVNFQLNVYPNPFNSFTTIDFKDVRPGQLFITIFDVNGRLVLKKEIPTSTSSNIKFLWNGKDEKGISLSSGIYYIIVRNITSQITYKSKVHKLVLVK